MILFCFSFWKIFTLSDELKKDQRSTIVICDYYDLHVNLSDYMIDRPNLHPVKLAHNSLPLV